MGCEVCGAPVSGRRRYCTDVECIRARERAAKRRQRTGADVVPLVQADARLADAPHADVLDATRRVLEDAGRLDTPAGQAALVLASRLTSSARESGSALAQITKQLLATLDEALRDAVIESTPLLRLRDELEARRERRRQSSA